MGLFGKDSRTPRDKIRDWITKLRKETMLVDRQIRGIQREEAKTKTLIKESAKRGDEQSCLMLAKELVRSKRTITRLNTSKAHIHSVILTMNGQLANAKVSGALEKSSDIMKAMQNLVRVPEIAQSMQELSKEMMKAGIMEEMVGDIVDQLNEIGDQGEMDDEVKDEVEKVLFETTAGKMGKVSGEKMKKEPSLTGKKVSIQASLDDEKEEEQEEITAMERRLEALRS